MTLLRFGEFQLDPSTGELFCHDDLTVLRPQVNKLLCLFLRSSREILSKERIMAELWPGEHVADKAFFQVMNHLRKVLGDNAQEPSFIQTFPRKGYRWLAETEVITPVRARSSVGRARFLSMGALLIVVFTLVGFSLVPRARSWSGSTVPEPVADKTMATPLRTPANTSLRPLHQQVKQRLAEGDVRGSKEALERLADAAEATGDTRTQISALLNLAHIYRFENPRRGLGPAAKAVALATPLTLDNLLLRAHLEKGLLHLELGDEDAARDHLARAADYRSGSRRVRAAELAFTRGIVALRTGRDSEAEQALARIEGVGARSGYAVALGRILEASLLLDQGAADTAKVHAKEAWSFFERKSMPIFAARAALLVGICEAGAGDYAAAHSWLEQSYELAAGQDLDYWQAKTAWSWAAVYRAEGKHRKARSYRSLAETLLKPAFAGLDDRVGDLDNRPFFFL